MSDGQQSHEATPLDLGGSGVVYRPAAAAGRLGGEVRRAGYDWALVDCRGRPDKQGFLDACAAALDFPAYFGRNWDALADCLTDVVPAPGTNGLVVGWAGWDAMAAEHPDDYATAHGILADFCAAAPGPTMVVLTRPVDAVRRGSRR